ncbi:MAG: hypothetical protein H3C28_03055 [Sphingomonadales bacterium]|nr:hypothetical protein [Sphingomonadales bacterium]
MTRHPPYRKEDGVTVIDVALSDPRLLFSELDPSPIREKDLDDTTEDYIVGALREVGTGQPIKLVFHVPAAQLDGLDVAGVRESLKNYFSYRAWGEGESLRAMLRTAWVSLAIGLAFLIGCLAVRQFLIVAEDTAAAVLKEGLLISGWVAMWRPIELLLYDWWPIWRRRRLYTRLSKAPVEFRGSPLSMPSPFISR